jgi:hypothetical protein
VRKASAKIAAVAAALALVAGPRVAAACQPAPGHEAELLARIERADLLGHALALGSAVAALALLAVAHRRRARAGTLRRWRTPWLVGAIVGVHPGWWWPTGGDCGASRVALSLGATALVLLIAGVAAWRAGRPPRAARG